MAWISNEILFENWQTLGYAFGVLNFDFKIVLFPFWKKAHKGFTTYVERKMIKFLYILLLRWKYVDAEVICFEQMLLAVGVNLVTVQAKKGVVEP